MFIAQRKTLEKEKHVKYCVTVFFKKEEELTMYFNSEKDSNAIVNWFYHRDTDCLFIEYNLDPITGSANDQILLDRKTCLKIVSKEEKV